ncbi:hypothetical protein BSPWISOXPB_1627 [uncultured Gammaproteobacteria bacterium]|nr:hypothetical protein BSPWISOXPB_1627 [uncultured Gammaproteobacteria bacterium]
MGLSACWRYRCTPGSGYTKIYSTDSAFAALKTNGSITAWGDSGSGGTGAPLVMAIPRFIQLGVPLPPLKLTEQSRCGVI